MSEKLTKQPIDSKNNKDNLNSVEIIKGDPNKTYETITSRWYEGQGPDGWVIDHTDVITNGADIINRKEINSDTVIESHNVSDATYVLLHESKIFSYDAVGLEEELSSKITLYMNEEKPKISKMSIARDLNNKAVLFEKLAGRLSDNEIVAD